MNTRSLRPSSPLQAGVTATVKWFNVSKGYGFVAPHDGSLDAFLHVSVLQKAGMDALCEGAEIVCDLEQGSKGPQVCSVVCVNETSEMGSAPRARRQMDDEQSYEPMGDVVETIEGIVKFFSAEKGFGFVAPDSGGKDVFVGIGCLNRCGLQSLESGQRVRMNTRMGKKGPMAEDVEPM